MARLSRWAEAIGKGMERTVSFRSIEEFQHFFTRSLIPWLSEQGDPVAGMMKITGGYTGTKKTMQRMMENFLPRARIYVVEHPNEGVLAANGLVHGGSLAYFPFKIFRTDPDLTRRFRAPEYLDTVLMTQAWEEGVRLIDRGVKRGSFPSLLHYKQKFGPMQEQVITKYDVRREKPTENPIESSL